MELDFKRNSIINAFWGIVNRMVGILGPFITRTFIIYILGDQYSGLNSVFFSILNVLNLAELGFGNAVVFSMYKPIAENNNDKICALLNQYKKIFRMIGVVIATIGLLLVPFLDKFVAGTYPDDINLVVVYIIYLTNTVLSYLLFAYKNSLLNAYQRVDIISNIASVINICLYLAQCISLVLLRSYYAYIIIMPIATILNNVVTNYVVSRKFPDILPRGNISKEEKNDMYTNVKALIGHKIGGTVVTSADNVVISAVLGLTIVSYYNNYHYIVSAIVSLVAIVMNGLLGGLGNRFVIHSKSENLDLMNKLTFLYCWVIGWCTICLLCLLQPFMVIWMGEDRLLNNSTVVLMALYFYAWQFRTLGLTVKDAAGMWQADFWKPYVGAGINIAINLILVNIIGLNGVLIATIIDMAFVYFPWESHVIFRDLFQAKPINYYMHHLLYFGTTILVAIFTYICCRAVPFTGVFGIILRGLICLFVPNVLYLLAYFRLNEFKYMIKVLKIRKGGN